MSDDALKLALQLQAASAAQTAGILQSIYTSAEADRRAVRAGVLYALSLAVPGGTTAQYERVLDLVHAALYPSPAAMDHYLSTVDRNTNEVWELHRIERGEP